MGGNETRGRYGREKSNYHRGVKENKCYFCGSGPPLREHHIIPQRFDGPDTTDNIVELCDLCHKRLERLYDKSFYEWFGVDDETGRRQFHRPCQRHDCDNQAKVKMRDGGMVKLLCRVCAAPIANKEYRRRLKVYHSDMESLHKHARTAHEFGWDHDEVWNIQRLLPLKKPTPDGVFDDLKIAEACDGDTYNTDSDRGGGDD